MKKDVENNTQLSTVNSQLPEGWEVKKLGEVCQVIAGQSPESKFYNDKGEGLPFYQGKKEFTDKFIGKPTKWTTKITKEAIKDDILMSVRAPVGPVNFATQKICIGRGLASIRAGKRIDKDFLFNFLQKHENEIIGNTGAVFNSINKRQIEAIPIPIPPLPEQKRIVAILDRAFEAIDKAKNIAEQNLKNAAAFFESYLNRIFENKGEDWEEKRFDEIVKYSKKPRGMNLDFPIDFIPMSFVPLNDIYITRSEKREKVSSGTFVKSGDLLLAKITPSFENGKQGIVKLNNEYAYATTEVIPFQGKENVIDTLLLFYFLKRQSIRKFLTSRMEGATGRQRLPQKALNEIDIPFPKSIQEQKRIVAQLDRLRAETKKLEFVYQKKIANLEELKKSVLQKAFRGEL